MTRTLVRDILRSEDVDRLVTVGGWVRSRRDSKGGFSFMMLNDGSCFDSVQIVADRSLPNYESEVLKAFPGSSVLIDGRLVASQGGGQRVEVQASDVRVLGFCEPTEYPLQKQRVSFERLREVAHLRPRTNTFGAVARLRNCLAFATHRFFQEHGFYYIHTPVITASDCEGAGEMFQVTTLDIDDAVRAGQRVEYAKDFFGQRAGLTVSGQLEAEAYACALGNVYTFGPTFRAEDSNTRRHLAEFWMVEPEMAFADLDQDARLAEDYLRFLFRTILSDCSDDLAFFNQRIDNSLLQRLQQLADAEFERLTYRDAVRMLENADVSFEFPVGWGHDLQSEHERYLTEQSVKGPIVLTDFPASIKPFYMRVNDEESTVAAMDVLLPQVGEIIGGSQREDRLDRLEARMRAMDLDPADYWWYCDLRRFGTVPHAGFGLGFERLVQFCSGMQNIRDVIPFPRTPRNVEF